MSPTFNKIGQMVLLSLVAMATVVVRWTRLTGLKKNAFLSTQALISFSKFQLKTKVEMEREISPSEFMKSWVTVVQMVRVNGQL